MQVTCVIAIALLCISSVFSAPATNDQLALNDVRVLQYALTLEHIEAFFYTQGQAKWTAADFQSIGLTSADYAYFEVIKNHEVAHVQFLQTALTAAKQTPVTACSNYNFAALGADPFASVAAYISIASALENAGVSAYGGAITSITNKDFVTAAATIHSVEARHAQYVNRLVNKTDTSSFVSFQPTVPPTGVAQIVTALNQTCAAKLTGLPSNLFDGPAADANQFSYTSFKDAAGANIYKPALDANDINLLQYALYLENFEAAFYDYFVGSGSTSFNAGQFTGAGYSSEVYTYLTLVRSHEIAHVDTLKTFITGLKATPVFPCIYNFSSIDSVPKFVSTAATIEPVGVSAYNGGANTATNRFQVLAAAASIVAVEARHASILAIFADQVGNATAFSPFPSTFDPAQRPADIRAAVLATGLLIELDGCAPAQLPVVYTQTSNYTTGTTTTGSTSVSSSTSGRASGGTTGANTASSLATVSALVMMIVVAVMYL